MKIQPRQFGKYLLLDQIGVGGMAEIWRAKMFGAAGFQKTLVIKKILRHLADNDEFVHMFIDEAKIAVSLQHANVVQIFDLGSVAKEYFIAMEYVFGKDLLNLLIRCTHLRIRVPHKLAIFIIVETLKGLEAAHNAVDSKGNALHIIHRDVSPSNVLISYDGEVRIGDFGVAKASKREAATRSGTMKGKLGYMSPEQVTGQDIDYRADLFSAGIILYEMLAMNRLFHGKTELETLMMVRDCDIESALMKLPGGVSEPLKDILRTALARDRDQRYQSATEFLDALLDHLFNEKLRVTTQDMGRFMKSVFAKEIEEEMERQKEIDGLIERMPPITEEEPAQPRREAISYRPAGASVDEQIVWSPYSQFRVRDRDGAIHGPMNLNTLGERVHREGRSAVHRISVDGSPWVKLDELPGLLEVEPPPEVSTALPDFTGSFERLSFPRLLYRYAACRATGRMHFESGSRRKEIYWRRGRPEYVTSNLRSELLGEYLVQRRLIARPVLDEALGMLNDFRGRLGDALLSLNAISAHDLFNALAEQVKTKLLEIFGWTEGSYAFFRGEATTEQIVPLEMSAGALVNEGIQRRLTLDDLKTHFRGREHLPFVRLRHKMLTPAMLALTTRQIRVWNAVGPRETVLAQFGRLQSIPGVDETDVYQVLFLMERLEFAAFEGEEI
ncbi:MAG: protein kinase [Myxococcales bacterium]|nr:protein kinase [Myxococcales bacterium]